MENKYDSVMTLINARRVGGGDFIRLDDNDLNALEQRLGYSLPKDYREFLKKYGCSTGYGDVKFRNMDNPEETESSVDVFYGVLPGRSYDLMEKKGGYGNRLLPHILPIASSPGGEFCISLADDDRGRIYWWELHSESDNLELIGRSFDSFVNSLRIVDD